MPRSSRRGATSGASAPASAAPRASRARARRPRRTTRGPARWCTVRVAEREQVRGRRARAAGVVGLHDAVRAVRSAPAGHRRRRVRGRPGAGASRASAVASFSTTTPSTPCSRSRSNASATVAVGAERHDRERVAAGGRGIRHRLQHARVAHRREGRDDEADGLGAAGAQRARGAVRAVAELGHGRLDAGAGGGIDAGAGVDDARDRLARHPGAARRRRPSRPGEPPERPCASSTSVLAPRHVDVTMPVLASVLT